MLGRLIQNNPFCLSRVDNLFFEIISSKKVFNLIILEYFEYIKKRIQYDSIYRLLSPLLNIFFAIPNSKKIKLEIHDCMKNKEIFKLEKIFLEFAKDQKILV